jgi:L-rhamnose mutarotase
LDLVGHVWRVKPGQEAEYLARHKTIWPELANLLRSSGVRTYTIYLLGDLVFSHMVVDDYQAMVRAVSQDPVSVRWEEQFKDILLYPDGDPETGWPARAVTVWDLEANP